MNGSLTMCDEEYCVVDGRRVPIEHIAVIELVSGAKAPATAGPGAVIMTDGTVPGRPFSGLNLGYVYAGDEEISREEVALIVITPMAGAAPAPVASEEKRETTAPVQTAPSPDPTPASPAVLPQAGSLVLNEIRFFGDEKAPQFVEILNASATRQSLAGFAVRNEKGQKIDLPRDRELAAGGFFLVPLERNPNFLGVQRGAVVLVGNTTVADQVAWGSERPLEVRLCRGGRCTEPPAGSVIARLPGRSDPAQPDAWSLLDPEQATPGSVNQRPRVSMIAGIPGKIYTKRPNFSWYGVTGAAEYRVQVGRDEDFQTVVWDERFAATKVAALVQEMVAGPDLPRGGYFWRVQAIDSDGAATEFSRPVSFRVAGPRRTASAFVRVALTQDAEQEPELPENRTDLGHQAHKQRKDTRMLMLEAVSEKNPRGWDVPDPASGRPYCARAAVVNVANHYGANLTLDRVGFEGFRKEREGPELDLPETGMDDSQTKAAIEYALGTTVQYHPNPGMRDSSPRRDDHNRCMDWIFQNHRRCGLPGEAECPACPPEIAWHWGATMIRHVKEEIDAGRPLIATTPGHVLVIAGYAEERDRFYLLYLDEVDRVFARVNRAGVSDYFDSYFTGLANVRLARQEPEIDTDRDGDGVVDFDETQRFRTLVDNPDSDKDGVKDKEEIRATVFDPQYGYARRASHDMFSLSRVAASLDFTARDKDQDGKAMELDPDSDGGGCEDGAEDADGDGRRDAGESSNFLGADDPRDEGGDKGCGVWAGTVVTRLVRDAWVWDFSQEVRLKQTRRDPLLDRSGQRVGTAITLHCAGTQFQVRLSGSDGCSAAASGEFEPTEPPGGILFLKTKDVDLTPLFGFDIPREGGMYAWLCGMTSLPATISCPGGAFTTPLPMTTFTIGNVNRTALPLTDPERRSLQNDRMTGSYRIVEEGNDVSVSWNLCRAGTPCGDPPALPEESERSPP